MNRALARYAAGILAILSLIIVGFFWYNNQRVGRVLDNYKGIAVYDNGLLFFRSYGKNYGADGYYYGQKWQCVEFVKRFYHQAKGHKMPDVWGHARDFFGESLPQGGMNSRRGLVQYKNGATEKPQTDDLMVFADTKFGHVAIVTEANENSLEVIQQNIIGETRKRFSLVKSNGMYFVNAPRVPIGWLRKESSGAAKKAQDRL